MSSSSISAQPEQLTLALGLPPAECSPVQALDQRRRPAPVRVELDLAALFTRAYRRFELGGAEPEFQAQFRPFAGLRSTIRLRGNRVEARVSDLLEDARPIVLEALAEILLAKLFRRRPSREARECYLAHTRSTAMTERMEIARRERGAKRQSPPRGYFFDLEEIFHQLNRRFFHASLPTPRLGWSPVRSRTILGHYDSAHSSITISRWLDSPRMPRYLVEYVMFHEMLHIEHPVERNGDRRVVHSRQFREAEKKFPNYERVRRKLKHICG